MKRRHFNALLTLPTLTGTLTHAQVAAPSSAAVLVVGDSLSAEYGLRRGSGWVNVLQQRLLQLRIPAHMVNAGISGDTSSGGRSRLPALLRLHKPSVVLIELGGNDALRGLPLAMTRDNLAVMARMSREAGARVVIVGMQVPPNYGATYAKEFSDLFKQVATAEKAALVPFLLKGVADLPEATKLFQEDRIHPNEAAQSTMANNVWSVLMPLLPKR